MSAQNIHINVFATCLKKIYISVDFFFFSIKIIIILSNFTQKDGYTDSFMFLFKILTFDICNKLKVII